MALILSVALVIFISGCAKKADTIESQFKNDVITIEDFAVDNAAPYSGTPTAIDFDIKNNGDTTVKNVVVNFFDIPGFTVSNLDCGIVKSVGNSCTYDEIQSLDTRHITARLVADNVRSPTPFTVSFLVKYSHSGSREAIIPVIDPVLRKEPTFKFSQSTPTFGPVVFDIQPLLEREKLVGDKTVKEYWGIKRNEFVTKFVMREVGTIKDSLPVNIPAGQVTITRVTDNLKVGKCDSFDAGKSKTIVNKTANTLICNFIADSTQSEFTSVLRIDYSYSYEFVRRVNFVVQPPIQ